MAYLHSLIVFIWIGAITPGPVNLVAVASGLHFGWRATWSFVLGASVAYTVVVFISGMGLGQLIVSHHQIRQAIVAVGVIYLLYMAYRIMTMAPIKSGESEISSPPSFVAGALMQWLNPKAWLVASSGIGIFISEQPDVYHALAIFCLLALVVCFIGVGSWVVVGQYFQKLLLRPQYQTWLNRALAVLLCIATIPIVLAP